MKEKITSSKCDFCDHQLIRALNSINEEVLICSNTKCPAGRLTHIEARLIGIERHLNIKSIPIRIISETEVEAFKPSVEDYSLDVEKLPQQSFQRGMQQFLDLETKLGRKKLISLIDEIAWILKDRLPKDLSYQTHLEVIHKYAILMAYSEKPFIAAQFLLEIGEEKAISFISTVIERANSVVETYQKKIEPKKFYTSLANWAEDKGLPLEIQEDLNNLAGIKPEIAVPSYISAQPEIVTTRPGALHKELIDISKRPPIQPRENWIDRFRPKEGWEFAIGANWLRWVGVGVSLFAIFSFVVWSGQQIDLTVEQLAIIIFICVVSFAIILHISSFFLLRRAKRLESWNLTQIAHSLTFLALGIYFIVMFTLRFHPLSPISGVEFEDIYILLCLSLIIVALVTAWIYNSSTVFLESFSFVIWLIWHISSQIFVKNLPNFPIDILWSSYLVFILVYLGIAYIRKDMLLTSTTQILALALLFLPNSSEIFSSHLILGNLNNLNATIILLVFICVMYLLIGFKFPLRIPNQFYELLKREHLSLSSVTPVFASFFLLSFGDIHGSVFLPFFLVFTSVFLVLAYYQKDLGVSFLIVLLTQFLWLLSVGTMENIIIFIPEINYSLIVLLFLTFANWVVALKFPTDIEPRFWNTISRKHLSVVAIGPIFVCFIMTLSNLIITSIFTIYLILFCILWSSVRATTMDFPDFSLQNVSIFDFVVYTSVVLFLVTVVLQPGDDILGLLLGFFAFPLFMLSVQRISRLSIQGRTNTKEYYAILNSGFISFTFIVMAWGNLFSQFSETIFQFVSEIITIPELHYDHNWAFLAYLWVIMVSIITTLNFRTEIHHYGSKLVMGVSSLFAIYLYLSSVRVSEIIGVLFVLASYLQFFILWYLLEPKLDPEGKTISNEHIFIIPTLAGVQIITYLLQARSIINWNIYIGLMANLVLPLLLGLLMVTRKRINHIVDSYLIASTSLLTLVQFSFLDSRQEGESWFIQLIFLGICLLFLYTRIFSEKDQLKSTYDSQSILKFIFPKSFFSNKDHFGANLLLLCMLGFINTTLCFSIFGVTFFPTIALLIFDSMIVFPFVFGLILLGINRRVAIVNTLTIYGSAVMIRLPLIIHLPFMREIDDFNWYLFLIIGLLIQVIIHFLLFRLTRSEELTGFLIDDWQFELEGRKSWTTDSYRLMVLVNPIIFYIFALELTLRVTNDFEMGEFISVFMIVIAVLIGVYFVALTRFKFPKTISDSGLFVSVLIAWLFTFSWNNLIQLIYFTTGATAFLCILYGFWSIRKEWRLLGLCIIGGSMVFSALYLVQLAQEIYTIIGFGMLGIISIVIGIVYSKFASRFEIKNEGQAEIEEGAIDTGKKVRR